jgi:hypothetical protein
MIFSSLNDLDYLLKILNYALFSFETLVSLFEFPNLKLTNGLKSSNLKISLSMIAYLTMILMNSY